jgi:cytochrome c oxidase subunit II
MNEGFFGFPLFPETASRMAGRVDALFFFLVSLTGLVTIVVAVLVIAFAVRYRRRPGREHEIPPQIEGSTPLELAWIIVPALLFMIPFVWGAHLYVEAYQAPRDAMTITGIGKQWMWKFQHPGGQREIDTLHVPIGRPVRLLLTSEDVIHSFYIPAFRSKQDVLPGRYTEVWIEATRPGTYHLFCSEYCGTAHSQMRGAVTALEPSAYERWLTLGASESLASRGSKLFQQLGCNTCHRADSRRRAPVLAGLYGRPVQLSDGRIVTADEDYLRESIVAPAAKVVFGWQPIMPTFQGRVSEDEIMQLIAYIQSLEPSSQGSFAPEGEPIFPVDRPAAR